MFFDLTVGRAHQAREDVARQLREARNEPADSPVAGAISLLELRSREGTLEGTVADLLRRLDEIALTQQRELAALKEEMSYVTGLLRRSFVTSDLGEEVLEPATSRKDERGDGGFEQKAQALALEQFRGLCAYVTDAPYTVRKQAAREIASLASRLSLADFIQLAESPSVGERAGAAIGLREKLRRLYAN